LIGAARAQDIAFHRNISSKEVSFVNVWSYNTWSNELNRSIYIYRYIDIYISTDTIVTDRSRER
jgi:hypothetical protein